MAAHVKSFPARVDVFRVRTQRKLLAVDARFLRTARRLWTRAARLVHAGDRAYRQNIRQVNRVRRVASHHYRQGATSVLFTWDAISLALRAERAGSRRYVNGLTS